MGTIDLLFIVYALELSYANLLPPPAPPTPHTYILSLVQWSVFESINVRYTSLSKQDVEVLRSNFEDTKIAS